ncbi:MAG: hypothetical protein NVS4B8_11310 [Herpetosiphon sp.]
MKTRNIGRLPLYVAIAVGMLIAALLTYGFIHAVTQASVALISGIILLIGNAPEVAQLAQQRRMGLGLLNSLVGVALICFFMTRWLGFVFYIPLIAALLFSVPLAFNRVAAVQRYSAAGRAALAHLRQLIMSRQGSVRR